MRKSQFRARVERLERREVLSTAHAGVVPFQGRGTGTLIAQQAILDGSNQTVSALKGKSHALGKFTGQLVLNFASDQFHIQNGSASFVGQGGDLLLTVVNGSLQVPKQGAFNTPGTLNYTVVGGTEAFANATGQGRIHVLEDLFNGNLRFTIHGSVQLSSGG